MFARACLLTLILAVCADAGSNLKSCGKPTVQGAFIVGGKEADDGEWPWQAALFRAGRRICGASLIDPEWILTAAHCIDVVTKPSMFQFLMGTNSLRSEDYEASDNTQFINVTGVYVHPNYRPYRSDYDIALLKLESPFEITDYVQTVCIPSNDAVFEDGTTCTVTGWGSTEFGGHQNPDLFEVEVPIVNQTECNRNYTSEITDDMICAGATGLDSCQGDSGGPMVTKVGDNWVQVGVVSWGTGCGFESYPGVYARVTYFSDWIEPIFNGGEPERLSGEQCSVGEFLCEGGYCYEYESKCDGSDSCYFETDEKYCETYVRYFDYKKGKKLEMSTSVDATNLDECAQKCLEYKGFSCSQFDFLGSGKCKIAEVSNDAIENTDDTLMHFELQYFKHDGEVFTAKSAAIASPAWTNSSSPGPWYSWTIETESSSVNAIRFDFNVTFSPATDCIGNNMVIVRAGNESNSKPVEASCVEMIARTVMVEGKDARLDFYTDNAQTIGFIATYTGMWSCDNTFMEEGKVTSPNYPDDYPNAATCRTLIQAPEGMTVELRMDDFSLEDDGSDEQGSCESDFDTLRIYDAPNDTDTENLFGEYCGDMINKTFVSSSNSMYLVFKSDSGVTKKGFKASFKFLTDEIPEHEKIINALNDSLNGYKFGLAGLFVFCLLAILVLSASLYTVTSRETDMYNERLAEKLKAPTRLVESSSNGNHRHSSNETQTPEGQVNYGFEAAKR